MRKERVVIAMSGGVDSAVASALLKEEGYEVIGMTMCFNLPDSQTKRPNCCGIQGIEDARRVAHKLGIRHYVLNLQKDLERWVIRDFCSEYLKGRTPNPCIRCNQYLKFGVLLKKALSLDAQFLATGHYARIEKGRHYFLKKAKDKIKDQSYFLYRLNQEQMKHILFPLGDYTKKQVRQLAKKFNLPVADKLASQEICFLPDTDYRGFLKHRLSRVKQIGEVTLRDPEGTLKKSLHSGHRLKDTDYADLKPGDIVDTQGNVLGRHQGIAFYTIGQREGLGIAKGYPLYITKIDAKNNRITVGAKEDAYVKEFLVKEPHFIFSPLKKKVAPKVKIRYNHKEAEAEVVPQGKQIKVSFRRPQFAVTPGQSAVFYDKDIVIGGGIIK